MRLPHMLVDLIAPPRCTICAASCDHDQVLCPSCDHELSRASGLELSIPGIDLGWAARAYEGVARELVHAIKFRRLLPATRRAAELIASESPAGLRVGTLVPVPADPLREAWRGFDVAELLARASARRLELPLSTCLRRSHGARQVGRSRRHRLGGPPRVSADDPPRAALLVDDVATTGATLAACAAALREAGCARVGAVVLAAART